MNPLAPLPDDEALDQAAAEWLYERENGFTPERAQAFTTWTQLDPRHAEAVRRAERTLELFDELPAIRTSLEARLANARAAGEPVGAARGAKYPWLAWAAGFAALLLLGAAAWLRLEPRVPPEADYTADAIAQRSLALSDGSVIDIDTGSEVSVRFTPKERHVTLRKGEADFQVAHNPAWPFIVTAGDVSVRAVGTEFDVRLAADAVAVVVVEGKVELGRSTGKLEAAPTGPLPYLAAGERADVARSDRSAPPRIRPIDAPSLRALLLRQNPMTRFIDEPLRDVLTRFNRRNATQLVLEDADLGERKIGGTFALDQVDAFVRLLEQDGDIFGDRRIAGQIGLRRAH